MSGEYEVLGGIYIVYNNICERNYRHNIHFDEASHIYEINHCQKGRFECELKDGTITYMSPGDFSINVLNNSPMESLFPIGFYSGITIYIDVSKFDEEAIVLQQIFEINYEKILSHICEGERLFIKRSSDEVHHIFCEIYNASPNNNIKTYLKIKIQELFHYLNKVRDFKTNSDRKYYMKSNINVIKNINKFINNNYFKHYTYKSLSDLFDIKMTTMKQCYKFVYNETINETIRNRRLKEAANLLRDTNKSITEIAVAVGYSDYSSFSKAFKKEYGIFPTGYKSCLLGHNASKKTRLINDI
ncbi:MAG: helix-turn-helix transcriptional regulator [Peptoniphilus harei]|uniref:Regulatory protein soxS n=2 Tax=Peptoniphilaceae TaxID=1570339 RepID=A0A380WUJ1_9FIRM|nr:MULTISPECIES: AraC family transcriptional regulator [Peptoniphilaceae]MBS5776156.1 helix-turn-helix transcriptional regulator [Finegoldia magna]MBS6611280.1 helix-turn-helix transcriptional regulator [Peptoniphilus harei]MDU1043988.1 AraC family transcriptional regulator [Peptoniphilus rhinitidis]SUU92721.1 Regulatory protein soxS [Anaerococcus octavius]